MALDRLRTAYARAPAPLRRLVSPVLSALPLRVRFGKTYQAYRAWIERSRHDADFVAAWQRDRLRALVGAAVARAPHYRRIGQALGLDERKLGGFEVADLASFPILTKEDLRGRVAEFLTRPAEELDAVSTGGSSGTPLAFYLDKDRSAKEWAFVQDSWSKAGFKPKDVRAVFRGVRLDEVDRRPWEFEPALGELRLSPFHLTDDRMAEYCALILEYGASFLHGYPSALHIFAQFVLRHGRDDVARKVKGVLAVSEPLFQHQRMRIARAFPHAEITTFYGLSEKVLFGSERRGEPGVFEMEPLYGIAELVDERGHPITLAGLRGRIVGTGLLFAGMPLIRYDTGDLGTLVEAATAANRYRTVVKDIVPRRSQEFLVGSEGQLISMTAVNIHSPAYMKMAAFQFHQSEPGKATLRAIPAPGCGKDDIAPFVEEVSAKIGRSLVFDVEIVERIGQSERGKSKFVDQEIDITGDR